MWKEKLKDFINWKDDEGNYIVDIKYLLRITKLYPNLIPIKEPKEGYPKERWEIYKSLTETKDEKSARENIMKLMESIVSQALKEGVSSFIWPTIIREPNLWLEREKNPTEEELWKILFLAYSAVKFGNFLINLDNVSDDGRSWLWGTLVTSKVVLGKEDLAPLRRELRVSLHTSEPFFNSLALLSFWLKKVGEETQQETTEKEDWQKQLQKYLPKLGWNDQTSLIIFGRAGKGVFYVFPKISNVVSRWLDPSIKLIDFLNSVIDGLERDFAGKEREKIIFYLFKYNQIRGDLLEKLVVDKCAYELKKKDRIYGIYGAKQFFSSI